MRTRYCGHVIVEVQVLKKGADRLVLMFPKPQQYIIPSLVPEIT